MFDSIRNWFGRSDRHQAGARELEAEAKQFKLPGETMPQIFKYVFMSGLALLNYRLFAHAVPGLWGQATGCVAMIGEAIALYEHAGFFTWQALQAGERLVKERKRYERVVDGDRANAS